MVRAQQRCVLRQRTAVPGTPLARICRYTIAAAFTLVPLACTGCDSASDASKSKPEAQPTETADATEKLPSLIANAANTWSREKAADLLTDETLGLSAAVRLVRLAAIDALAVPRPLTDSIVRRLLLLPLNETLFVLGYRDQSDTRRLRAPLLITTGGKVLQLATGVAEEIVILHVSKDPDLFPHTMILPDQVALLVDGEQQPAIQLETQQPVRFELRKEGVYSYIALLPTRGQSDEEVARYTWDPWERVFTGPAIDKLPDPPGGRFHIDLDASQRLEPVGGEIPEPEENVPPPNKVPAAPDWDRRLTPV